MPTADMQAIPSKLADRWQLHIATDADKAHKLAADPDVKVGMLLFAPTQKKRQPDWLHSLLTNYYQRIKWIAAVPQHCLAAEEISSLLAEYCYDYHVLPLDLQRLEYTLGHAHGMHQLWERTRQHKEQKISHCGMIGSSPLMRSLYKMIERTAGVDVPALVTGESGTGKELAALAIHQQSARSQGPFIAVNCAALPSSLIQSELFGHEKGAFTGAHKQHIGRIESAAGGTLFLDEIGDLPPQLQVNLLRFLQEKTIERVGGRESITVDARVIAATHVDLQQAVQESRFREDLFYRIHVLQIDLPALREREGDVIELAEHYLQTLPKPAHHKIRGFSRDAITVMQQHRWPGNVRELVNRIRQALIMSEQNYITPSDLGLEKRSSQRKFTTLEEARADAEQQTIQSALRRNQNNVSKAAEELGVSRVTLYRLMDKHSIDPNDARSASSSDARKTLMLSA